MEKNNYDLSHHGFKVCKLGRMVGAMCIKTLPGDVFDINQQIIISMSPYRRQIMMDARVDVFTCEVRDRNIYSNFEAFIEDGVDTAETLSVDTFNTVGDLSFLPHWTSLPTSKPSWYVQGPLQIYNRYVMPKSSLADPGAADALTTYSSVPWGTGSWVADDLKYGPPAAQLPTAIWTSGINRDLSAADFDIDSSGSTIDLTVIADQQARLATERDRQFTSYFYDSVIKKRGGSASVDADVRPRLIMQTTQYLGGENIRGTDNQSMGAITGRAGGVINHVIPRKYMPEHGTLWTFVIVRFPPISTEETMFLQRVGAGDWKNLVADYRITESQPPIQLQEKDLFDSSATNDLVRVPFAHWYRMHPSFADAEFRDQFGFTFAQGVPTTDVGENFYHTDIDDANFHSTQLGHFTMSIKNNVSVDRFLPTADSSIFAGTR